MFGFSRKYFTRSIAIDMGTANTRIYGGGDVVLDEPSVVAMSLGGPLAPKVLLAVGSAAAALQDETVLLVRPLRESAVVDLRTARKMLRVLIRKTRVRWLASPSTRAVVCVPCSATPVEIRALRQVVLRAGASYLTLLDEPMAAAIGAGLPVNEPKGSMVVALGAGTTEVGVIALGGLIYKKSIRAGGCKMDRSIAEYIKRHHGVVISELLAEQIKIELGGALPQSVTSEMSLRGYRLEDGRPMTFTVNSGEVLEALSAPLEEILVALKEALAYVPPDLSADLTESGIVLTGGGALLPGFSELLARETGLPVRVASEPLLCAVRGCYLAMRA
jgi:rod shape-determining protein MreB